MKLLRIPLFFACLMVIPASPLLSLHPDAGGPPPISFSSRAACGAGLYSIQACENATVLKKSVSLSRDNPIEVITTPAASKDCQATLKAIYRWGQWDHPLFPQAIKDPDISVRFGTTTGAYFPRTPVTSDSNRVCTTTYSVAPGQLKKEPIYYLARLEYSFFRMVINYLPGMGTDTVDCDVEISYFPCTATPYLILESSTATGTIGEPVDFTASLHNWDFQAKANPAITYQWYIEGVKKYETSEQSPASRITHTFDSPGDKTVRVHIVESTSDSAIKPLFKEQLTFKVKR